jgi:hypothetical protein
MAPKKTALRVRGFLAKTVPTKLRGLWNAVMAPKPAAFWFLIILGVGLIALGFLVYPHRAQPAPPAATQVSIISHDRAVNSNLTFVHYTITQGPASASVQITVWVNPKGVPFNLASGRPGPLVTVMLEQTNAPVIRCSPQCAPVTVCSVTRCHKATTDLDHGAQTRAPLYKAGAAGAAATATFFVKSPSFGMAANGLNAAVELPAVYLSATKPVLLVDHTPVPSAALYDWSDFPPLALTSPCCIWREPVAAGDVPKAEGLPAGAGAFMSARVVPAVDGQAQNHDNLMILVVGVLFGIGGGAIVAGLQSAFTS